MQLILLAAGKGSRLPSKERNSPKCMVNINNKTILSHNLNFYNKFKDKVIITGFKAHKLRKFIKSNNFKEIRNKEFNFTNMVYSLFKIKDVKEKEIVICYSDIIFDQNIFQNFIKRKKNIILLKKNWLKVWKGRMPLSEIIKDAEDVKVEKNILKSIGKKIKNKLPTYQFMGIVKISTKEFFKLKVFFKQIKDKRIDFTNFINLCVKEKKINFNVSITKKYWYEIDSLNDMIFVNKEFKKKLSDM